MKLDSVKELKRSFLLRAAVVKERTVRGVGHSGAAQLTAPPGQSVAVAYGAAPMEKKSLTKMS